MTSANIPSVYYLGAGIVEEEILQRLRGTVYFKKIDFAALSQTERSEAVLEALRSDLWIISLRGTNPEKFTRELMQLVGNRAWSRRRARIVLRTQNSHHQFQSELNSLEMVDQLAIAHGNYAPRFPTGKVTVEPCAVERIPKKWAESAVYSLKEEKSVDVVFPFSLYPGAARNRLAAEVIRRFDSRGISYRFGLFTGWQESPASPRLWLEMARARVILNLPTADDFNIRNYESALTCVPQVGISTWKPNSGLVGHTGALVAEANPDAICQAVAQIVKGEIQFSSEEMHLLQRDVIDNHFEIDRVTSIIQNQLSISISGPKQATALEWAPPAEPENAIIYSKNMLCSASLLTPLSQILAYLDRKPSWEVGSVPFLARLWGKLSTHAFQVATKKEFQFAPLPKNKKSPWMEV